MVSLTLAVPKELKEEMDKHSEVNWSAVARNAIQRKLELLLELDKLAAKSDLTQTDAIHLGRKVNKALSKRYS